MQNDEFYIGWMQEAPKSFSAWIKKYLFVLLTIIIMLGVLLALSQKKFDSGNFEFGKLTEVKGIYFSKPVPVIKVIDGKDIWGNENYITVPLIGFGKHGADGVIADIEKEKNISLEAKEVTLKGTLLYNDGKLLMQIDANDEPLISVADAAINIADLQKIKQLGTTDIKGEIVDPKCFFGVMKPGEGKPHKDCAIRCILGGIPPVLKVTNEEGRQNYYLIVGADGEKMNDMVQDYVAAPVTIHANAVEYGDWIVLYVQQNGLQHYSYIQEHYNSAYVACSANCLK
ncbi:hypothetical protein FRZ67_17110 [Panacibacter ginsenosidivorans]|uniref:Uncharacterized protein n=1 Tax=Panacibacter ginsenosidivorans TaxID=1813871 RepID=A0A5B8VD73_9BACT|nr:hypothetical protein [Panacibacter ginsenosidivorans]QEC68943.1 hypothetical protein FRZ67_17110 [Panacibacter ginsenosidivorans]